MRVVAGELRRRRLLGPPEGVRPTSDRVREALFDRLGDLDGARVLDLFAGTGALAIEALSRGAAHAVLVERSTRSLNVIRANLDALALGGRAEVVSGDAVRVVRRLAGGERFDGIFLDPPYDSDRLVPCLEAVVAADLLAERGVVVVETAKRHPLAAVSGLAVVDDRVYGDTRLTWLEPEPRPGRSHPA